MAFCRMLLLKFLQAALGGVQDRAGIGGRGEQLFLFGVELGKFGFLCRQMRR